MTCRCGPVPIRVSWPLDGDAGGTGTLLDEDADHTEE